MNKEKLQGKRKVPPLVLVTGGPTIAWLDSVRFVSNLSSGETAYILCKELIQRGLSVYLVSGPCSMPFEKLGLQKWIPIKTGEEMERAVLEVCSKHHPTHAIFSAAVLDFLPYKKEERKVPSSLPRWTITLKPSRKIIDQVGQKFPNIKRIGFKLESKKQAQKNENDLDSFWSSYLKKKKWDAICVNYLEEIQNSKHPTTLYTRIQDSPISSKNKKETAEAISDLILALYPKKPKKAEKK